MEAGPTFLLHAGGPSLVTSWSLEPFQLVPLVLIAVAYARRAAHLRRQGRPVPTWRLLSFATAIALILLALVSPVGAFAEDEFFFVHMIQHLLLGDLAPLAFVAGLTGPLLRPVLALPVVRELRVLGHPLVALPLWAVNLYVWHLPGLYQAAVRDDVVHAVQHVCFFTAGALMWGAVLEVLPGPRWFGTAAKLGFVVAVRLIETVLANVFLWANSVFYPVYRHPSQHWGISPIDDQRLAGSVMLVEGSVVTIVALAWLFLRLAGEGELRQRLIERGLDPASVARAVRYGRGEGLSDAR